MGNFPGKQIAFFVGCRCCRLAMVLVLMRRVICARKGKLAATKPAALPINKSRRLIMLVPLMLVMLMMLLHV